MGNGMMAASMALAARHVRRQRAGAVMRPSGEKSQARPCAAQEEEPSADEPKSRFWRFRGLRLAGLRSPIKLFRRLNAISMRQRARYSSPTSLAGKAFASSEVIRITHSAAMSVPAEMTRPFHFAAARAFAASLRGLFGLAQSDKPEGERRGLLGRTQMGLSITPAVSPAARAARRSKGLPFLPYQRAPFQGVRTMTSAPRSSTCAKG